MSQYDYGDERVEKLRERVGVMCMKIDLLRAKDEMVADKKATSRDQVHVENKTANTDKTNRLSYNA